MLFSLFRCFSMAQYYFYNYFIKLFPKKTIEKRTREYQEWKAGRGLVWEWGREQASPEPRWVVRTLCWCWGALRTPVLNAVTPPRNLAASHLSCDSHSHVTELLNESRDQGSILFILLGRKLPRFHIFSCKWGVLKWWEYQDEFDTTWEAVETWTD